MNIIEKLPRRKNMLDSEDIEAEILEDCGVSEKGASAKVYTERVKRLNNPIQTTEVELSDLTIEKLSLLVSRKIGNELALVLKPLFKLIELTQRK